MCWADKLGVLWAFVVYLFFIVIAQDRAGLFTPGPTLDLLFIIAPVWIFFRLIDWIAGGPARRKGVITVRPVDRY